MDTKKFLALVEKKKKEAEQKQGATSDWAKKLEEAAQAQYVKPKKKHKKEKKRRKHGSRDSKKKHDSSSSSEADSGSESDSDGESSESERESRRGRRKERKSRNTSESDADSDGEKRRRRKKKGRKSKHKSRERSVSSGDKKRRKHGRESADPYSSDSSQNTAKDRRKKRKEKERGDKFSDDASKDVQKRHKSKSRTPEPVSIMRSPLRGLPSAQGDERNAAADLPPLPPRRKSVTPEPRHKSSDVTAQVSTPPPRAEEKTSPAKKAPDGVDASVACSAQLGKISKTAEEAPKAGAAAVLQHEMEAAMRQRALASIAQRMGTKGEGKGKEGNQVEENGAH